MKKKTILAIDDDQEIHDTITPFLESKGYELKNALDGAQGLKLAKTILPDLILLDVRMPNMDGWAFIRHLRILTTFTFTPVIFLSTVNDAESRGRGFQLGADDFIDKKYIFEELPHRIEKVLAAADMYKRSALLEVKSVSKNKTSFSGRLEDFGLPSLVSICRMEQTSGVLVLENMSGYHGMVYIKGGEIASAKLVAERIEKSEDAIFKMIGWNVGTFELQQMGTQNIPQEIDRTTDSILLEAVSRMDECSRH